MGSVCKRASGAKRTNEPMTSEQGLSEDELHWTNTLPFRRLQKVLFLLLYTLQTWVCTLYSSCHLYQSCVHHNTPMFKAHQPRIYWFFFVCQTF